MQAYLHQNEILKDPRKKLVLAWDTGTGKTYGAELLSDHHKVSCLIIVPKAQNEKWLFLEAKGHVVFTKEYFRDHQAEMIEVYENKNLNGIIIDEAHYFAGVSSGLTKTLKKFCNTVDPEYMWLLTATPVLSTPWNVYTLAVHCGMNPHYAKFRKMFFFQIRMGMRTIWQPKKNTDHLLHALLLKFCVWVDFDDVSRDNDIEYDTSTQTKKEIFLHQPVDQKKAEYTLTQEGIALWTKKHTVQNGFYDDEYEGCTYFDDPKLDHVLKTARKQPKLAVICRYHRQIERYEQALTKAGHEVYIIKGGTKDIEGLSKKLDKMEKVVVIIQSNISEGYELPNFPYAIFASLSFSYKDWKQMNGRFLRINAITPTHVEVLLIVDGIDIDVYRSVSNKEDFYLSKLPVENFTQS